MISNPVFSWSAYLVSGAAALAISVLVTGCRFGNQVVNTPDKDPISGYYETQPQSLTMTAIDVLGHSVIKTAATNLVPAETSNAMSNPVGLAVDMDTGDALFFRPSNTAVRFVAGIKSDLKTLSFSGRSDPTPLWRETACVRKRYLEETGEIIQDTTLLTSASAGFPYPVKGRIQVEITATMSFEGDCTASLAEMAACYNDLTQCSGSTANESSDNQGYVQSLFNPYIDAGTMTAQDIPNIRSMVYVVSYQ